AAGAWIDRAPFTCRRGDGVLLECEVCSNGACRNQRSGRVDVSAERSTAAGHGDDSITELGGDHELGLLAVAHDARRWIDAAAGRCGCGHCDRYDGAGGRLGMCRAVGDPFDHICNPCIELLAAVDELACLIEIESQLRF